LISNRAAFLQVKAGDFLGVVSPVFQAGRDPCPAMAPCFDFATKFAAIAVWRAFGRGSEGDSGRLWLNCHH